MKTLLKKPLYHIPSKMYPRLFTILIFCSKKEVNKRFKVCLRVAEVVYLFCNDVLDSEWSERRIDFTTFT